MAQHTGYRRMFSVAAIIWSMLFAAPHAWWAIGITAGFPGGDAAHERWMSSNWRYGYNVVVAFLGVLAALTAFILYRGSTPRAVVNRARWIACVAGLMLALRGIAGLIVDGTTDLVWWPTFLTGGLLFIGLAFASRDENDRTYLN